MKKICTLLLALLASSVISLADGKEWHDASEFPVFGKITDNTNTRYDRLPAYLKDVTRAPVWRLGRNSAGLFVRFRSDSPEISLRWTPLFNNSMSHMADTGTKGLDLYALTDDGWRYVRCVKMPKGKKSYEVTIACDAVEREYMLYLSLYDGVKALSIGIKEGYMIGQPERHTPRAEKPVIMYGSSLQQGGCCSRPGMAYTNILARRLDREVINLGFSGNGKIDYEIAEYMASHPDPGVFVLEYVPNSSPELIDEKAEKFFHILRDAHPDVPVIFVQTPNYPRCDFNTKERESVKEKNAAQRRVYEKLRKAGNRNLFFIFSEGALGDDGEATVDGSHFTDLGMVRYVDHILPTIKKALKKSR